MKKALVIVLVAGLLMFSVVGIASARPGHSSHGTIIKKQSVSQRALIFNLASATTGSAVAVGNKSHTVIVSHPSSIALNGNASNTDNISVTNSGNASATSGEATTVNEVNNSIGQSVNQ